jgi:hypothetical protein
MRNLGRVYLPILSSSFEHGDHGWKDMDEKKVDRDPGWRI